MSFDVQTSYDDASGGYKLTVSWDGPSDSVFEDCFDFGKNYDLPVDIIKNNFERHEGSWVYNIQVVSRYLTLDQPG